MSLHCHYATETMNAVRSMSGAYHRLLRMQEAALEAEKEQSARKEAEIDASLLRKRSLDAFYWKRKRANETPEQREERLAKQRLRTRRNAERKKLLGA